MYNIVIGVSCSAPTRTLLAPIDYIYFDDRDYVVMLFLYFLFAFSARRAAFLVTTNIADMDQ